MRRLASTGRRLQRQLQEQGLGAYAEAEHLLRWVPQRFQQYLGELLLAAGGSAGFAPLCGDDGTLSSRPLNLELALVVRTLSLPIPRRPSAWGREVPVRRSTPSNHQQGFRPLHTATPAGVLADVYSRRLAVILGLALIGAGFLMEESIPQFWAILLWLKVLIMAAYPTLHRAAHMPGGVVPDQQPDGH